MSEKPKVQIGGIDLSKFIRGIKVSTVSFNIEAPLDPPPKFHPFALMLTMKPFEEERLPELDPIAREFWSALFKKPWPEGWSAFWTNAMSSDHLGAVTQDQKKLYMNYYAHMRSGQFERMLGMTGWTIQFPPDSLNTLIHELLHVAGYHHTNRLSNWLYERCVDYFVWKAWNLMQ